MKSTDFKFVLLFFTIQLFCLPLIAKQDSLLQVIEQAKDQNDFETYYKSLSLLEKYFIAAEDFQKLEDHSFYSYSPTNASDSLIYRRYTMLHGFRLFRHLGLVYESLKHYLVAHRHWVNKDLNDKNVWFTEKAIAIHYARLNDYDQAIRYSLMVEEHLKETNNLGKLGRLYSDLGDLYLWQKDTTKAIKYYQHGLSLGDKDNNAKAKIANLSSLALLYLDQNKIELFERSYLRIKNLFSALDTSDVMFQERLVEIETLEIEYLKHQGKHAEVESKCKSLVSTYKERYKGRRVREIAKVYLELGNLSLERSDLEKAKSYCNEGLSWLIDKTSTSDLLNEQSPYLENTMVDLLVLKAKNYELEFSITQNHSLLDSALLILSKAFQTNQWIYNELSFSSSQFNSIEDMNVILSLAIKYCYTLWTLSSEEKYLDNANEIFLNSKSILLNQKINDNRILQSLPQVAKDSFIKLESNLLIQIERYSLEPEPSDSILRIIYSIKEDINDYKDGCKIDNSALEQYQGSYLEYFWTDDALYVLDNFSLNPFRRIDNSEILENLILDFLQSVENKSESYARNLEKLRTFLLPVDWTKQSSLTVIPDGKLLTIPMDLLFFDNQGNQELPKVTYRYSRMNKKQSTTISSEAAILFLAPKYTITSEPIATRQSKGKLLYTDLEGKAIENNWQGSFTKTTDCSISDLVQYSNSHEIFHYSGHAVGSGNMPKLLLTDKLDYENFISNTMIEEANLDYELVVLSACETGMGKFENGEGVRSLAYSFLTSGVHNVVYSLWSINDQTTSKIMGLFYKELAAGKKVSEALRQAKLEFLRKATPEERHPYYWAGFVAVGDNLEFSSSSYKFKWPYIFVILGLGAIILLTTKTQTNENSK